MEERNIDETDKKDMVFCYKILLAIYLLSVLRVYAFSSSNVADCFFGGIAGLTLAAGIPVFISLIAYALFKRPFWRLYKKTLIFIAVPLTILIFFGAHLHKKETESIMLNKYESAPSNLSSSQAERDFYNCVGPELLTKSRDDREGV